MQRREFLRTAAMAAVGGAVLVGGGRLLGLDRADATAAVGGRRYRGTSDGKVLVSSDGGRTWSVHTSFGSHLAVTRVGTDRRGQVVARMSLRGHPFELTLGDDDRTWRTV